METKYIIETIGYILKEEKLTSLKHHILPNTLVLETTDPYPGYHGKDLPVESSVPDFIFFVTSQKYTSEQLARITMSIRKYFKEEVDIARAEITIYNSVLHGIRIKGLKDYKSLENLQLCFRSEGIALSKGKKIDASGMIKIQKQFIISEIIEGIFSDVEDANTSYIQIPIQLSWEKFRAMTVKIKNTLDYKNFDAAMGLFYRKNGITDFIRIYYKEGNTQHLKEIHSKYVSEIKKLVLDSLG
jgi:hypothetical protein